MSAFFFRTRKNTWSTDFLCAKQQNVLSSIAAKKAKQLYLSVLQKNRLNMALVNSKKGRPTGALF
jgi:hypothetical protein